MNLILLEKAMVGRVANWLGKIIGVAACANYNNNRKGNTHLRQINGVLITYIAQEYHIGHCEGDVFNCDRAVSNLQPQVPRTIYLHMTSLQASPSA